MRPGLNNNPKDENDRETGARKYPWSQGQQKQTDQRAATPKPDKPYGLTQPRDETSEKTRQSEGVDQRSQQPSSRHVAGARPAMSEHSKDATASHRGASRQPAAERKGR